MVALPIRWVGADCTQCPNPEQATPYSCQDTNKLTSLVGQKHIVLQPVLCVWLVVSFPLGEPAAVGSCTAFADFPVSALCTTGVSTGNVDIVVSRTVHQLPFL